jgi:hypothetical protein
MAVIIPMLKEWVGPKSEEREERKQWLSNYLS